MVLNYVKSLILKKKVKLLILKGNESWPGSENEIKGGI